MPHLLRQQIDHILCERLWEHMLDATINSISELPEVPLRPVRVHAVPHTDCHAACRADIYHPKRDALQKLFHAQGPSGALQTIRLVTCRVSERTIAAIMSSA